jgi:hypothetical protein
VIVPLKDHFIDNDCRIDAFQFLQIDTDRNALQDLRHSDAGLGLSAKEIVAMPLRTSAQYRSATDMDLSWMSRRWLFSRP